MAHLSTADSFSKGISTQLQPRMLFAIVLPFVIALGSSIVLLIFAWGPLDTWFMETASKWSWLQSTLSSLGAWSIAVGGWLSSLISFVALVAIGVVIGLAAASIMVTPIAVKFISENYFPHLEKRGQNVNTVSTYNAVKVSVIFVLGWLITLPLWLIPFMSVLLSLFWGAYVFAHMSQVDAIVEHATTAERQYIIKHYKNGFWLIGFVCSVLSLIPFVGLVMPVFSIIVCTHYGLKALDNYRQQQATAINGSSTR